MTWEPFKPANQDTGTLQADCRCLSQSGNGAKKISEQKPGVLDKFAAEQAKLLDKEITELDDQASRFAEEIEELGGTGPV